MKRRDIIKSLTLLPLSGVAGAVIPSNSVFAGPRAEKRDLFKELGVTPVINAGVTMTFLSGSLMMPEVLDAINSTA
ncbi:MAG: selenocysteine synthase, partial [Ginsengibacter sp.]